MTFSKAVTSSKFSLIRFRWWSSWYHQIFRSQIVRPSQITYPIRIQQTTRLAKKSNWICERKLSKWCDNESIQATLFPFKNDFERRRKLVFSKQMQKPIPLVFWLCQILTIALIKYNMLTFSILSFIFHEKFCIVSEGVFKNEV